MNYHCQNNIICKFCKKNKRLVLTPDFVKKITTNRCTMSMDALFSLLMIFVLEYCYSCYFFVDKYVQAGGDQYIHTFSNCQAVFLEINKKEWKHEMIVKKMTEILILKFFVKYLIFWIMTFILNIFNEFGST